MITDHSYKVTISFLDGVIVFNINDILFLLGDNFLFWVFFIS